MSTSDSNPFRLPSYNEFGDYAANIAALLLLPLQFCQEWLARLYGYSGLHELRKVYETKGNFGPFVGEELSHPDTFAQRDSARQSRLTSAVSELQSKSSRAKELGPILAHMGLFLRPKRHRSRASRVLWTVNALERFGFRLEDIAETIGEIPIVSCDHHRSIPAVNDVSEYAQRLGALPCALEDQYWEVFKFNLPFLYEAALKKKALPDFEPEEWGYQDECPPLDALVEDVPANMRWLLHAKAELKASRPSDALGQEAIARLDDTTLLNVIRNPGRTNSEPLLTISHGAREWERTRRTAWLDSYRKHCVPVTLVQTAQFRHLTDTKYAGYRLVCTILLRLEAGKAHEEQACWHAFSVNYSLVHVLSDHQIPFAVGHGHLFVPRKGSGVPDIVQALEELRHTAFEPLAEDVQAYWEQAHPKANYGIVTNRQQPPVAIIDIEMAEGFSHEDWTEDLLTIFKSELADHAGMTRNRAPIWAEKGARHEPVVAPAVFFVSLSSSLIQQRPVDASLNGDRPFVAAVKKLPDHVPFDTVIVDAFITEAA
jgi:hypothetical protein